MQNQINFLFFRGYFCGVIKNSNVHSQFGIAHKSVLDPESNASIKHEFTQINDIDAQNLREFNEKKVERKTKKKNYR